MEQLRKKIVVGVAICGFGVAAGSSCNRQINSQCLEEIEYTEPEAGTPAFDYPYCEWTYSTLPQPPDDYAFTYQVGVGFIPSDDNLCDPCDIERLEDLLRSSIQERMSQGSASCARTEPSEPVGVCISPPSSDTSGECRVQGLFYSNYPDAPVEHGCADCREAETCG